MPYVTSFERLAREEGREEGKQVGREEGKQVGREEGKQEGVIATREAIAVVLSIKFEEPGVELMPAINEIADLDKLRKILAVIPKAATADEIREFLA